MAPRLRGIFCPMATPLASDGTIERNRIRDLVDHLIERGVDGLVPLGTSGEFAMLSDEEKRIVMEDTIDQTNGRVPVVAGVSDPSIEKVIRQGRLARDLGADAVLSTSTYYFPNSDDGHYRFYKRVSRACDIPLMVYNIPEWTHSFVSPETVGRLADEKLIVGMKYTQYNFLNLLEFLSNTRGKIAVFTGSDALAYSALEFGAAGAIMGVSNLAPKISSSIYDEFKRGQPSKARENQMKLLPAIEAMGIGNFPAGLKEGMRCVGFPVGDVKEPLTSLNRQQKERVRKLLREAGLAN